MNLYMIKKKRNIYIGRYTKYDKKKPRLWKKKVAYIRKHLYLDFLHFLYILIYKI